MLCSPGWAVPSRACPKGWGTAMAPPRKGELSPEEKDLLGVIAKGEPGPALVARSPRALGSASPFARVSLRGAGSAGPSSAGEPRVVRTLA